LSVIMLSQRQNDTDTVCGGRGRVGQITEIW